MITLCKQCLVQLLCHIQYHVHIIRLYQLVRVAPVPLYRSIIFRIFTKIDS